jgi:hypothetical protein
MDDDLALKRRKEIEEVIKKAVKSKLIDVTETENGCIINFETSGAPVIKDTIFQVVVTLDYYKKVYRGMHRAVYINISKQTNTYRTTDNIQIDILNINDGEYAKTLDSIKKKFESLCLTTP